MHDNGRETFLCMLEYKLGKSRKNPCPSRPNVPKAPKNAPPWGICEKFSPSPKEPTCVHNVGMLWGRGHGRRTKHRNRRTPGDSPLILCLNQEGCLSGKPSPQKLCFRWWEYVPAKRGKTEPPARSVRAIGAPVWSHPTR